MNNADLEFKIWLSIFLTLLPELLQKFREDIDLEWNISPVDRILDRSSRELRERMGPFRNLNDMCWLMPGELDFPDCDVLSDTETPRNNITQSVKSCFGAGYWCRYGQSSLCPLRRLYSKQWCGDSCCQSSGGSYFQQDRSAPWVLPIIWYKISPEAGGSSGMPQLKKLTFCGNRN